MRAHLFPFLPLILLGACATADSTFRSDGVIDRSLPVDVHSLSRPNEARVEHVVLDLTVDFDNRRLQGSVTLHIARASEGASQLVLDTADGLEIDRIVSGGIAAEDCQELAWTLGDPDEHLGRALSIDLPEPGADLAGNVITVRYRTTPNASALQWLEPSQTLGGSKPFLFTQGQAILTRSWIPLQDSPGVRVSYQATIRVDPSLGVVPVMSASLREDLGRGVFHFGLDKPIPAYLIALAIGDLESREISPRCAVWSEPEIVDRAAAEFEDTERMIAACEELYGPYRWGRYDILVLPPAFPFGGMENPCLTFATPTILAGDKSLVALIAHELAHSWSGNLVTNATWSDFWLNEGFTVYLEQRIVEAIYGVERARMETLLGLRQLGRELRELPTDEQRLHIDLRGRNPDDGMTAIAYDKGAAFLRRLEQLVGRVEFDSFLAGYFDAHAFESITTDEFLAYLDEHLLSAAPSGLATIDIDEWVHGPGLPSDAQPVLSAAFERVDRARSMVLSGGPPVDTSDWATTHWLHFLNGMPETLTSSKMAQLDSAFEFTKRENAEVLTVWLTLSIRHGYAPADERLEQFLIRVGRRKFLLPLYEALKQTESAGGIERARAIYLRARQGYHAVSRRTLDALLLES